MLAKGLGGWVGESRKWLVLLTFSNVFMLSEWVGQKKIQNYDDVIYIDGPKLTKQ